MFFWQTVYEALKREIVMLRGIIMSPELDSDKDDDHYKKRVLFPNVHEMSFSIF